MRASLASPERRMGLGWLYYDDWGMEFMGTICILSVVSASAPKLHPDPIAICQAKKARTAMPLTRLRTTSSNMERGSGQLDQHAGTPRECAQSFIRSTPKSSHQVAQRSHFTLDIGHGTIEHAINDTGPSSFRTNNTEPTPFVPIYPPQP